MTAFVAVFFLICFTGLQTLAAYIPISCWKSFWILVSHIRSMWETICDAWACWSGWNFGQILQFSPYSEVQNTLPKMKIVTESKSESFRIPPQNENCQRVQVRESQNTPKMKICQRVQVWEFQNTPQMKIVTESKSESFRIPPPKFGKTSNFKRQNSLKIREIYVETNL